MRQLACLVVGINTQLQLEVMRANKVPITPAVQQAVTNTWARLEALHVTRNKPAPTLFCFEADMVGASMLRGVSHGDAIGISNGLAGANLVSTVIEELGHYITGADDNTRDLQTWAFTLAAKALESLQ